MSLIKALEELDDNAAYADQRCVQTQLHEQLKHVRGEKTVAQWLADVARGLTLLNVQLMYNRERLQCALNDPKQYPGYQIGNLNSLQSLTLHLLLAQRVRHHYSPNSHYFKDHPNED